MDFIFSEHSWRILYSLFNMSQKALEMLRTVLEEKCTFICHANMGAVLIPTDTMLSLEKRDSCLLHHIIRNNQRQISLSFSTMRTQLIHIKMF